VVAGRRDDELVLFQILVEDHLAGLGILYPEVFRHFGAAAEHRIDLRANVIGDPVHRFGSCPDEELKQFQEKCVAVFRPELRKNKYWSGMAFDRTKPLQCMSPKSGNRFWDNDMHKT
jgi:hypothetical protein